MSLDAWARVPFAIRPSTPVAARRVAALVFAAQGASVAALSTTVPAVTEHLHITPALTTVTMAGIALLAGVGSFAGLAVVRRQGPVAAMRGAVLAVALALLVIGWAPGWTTALCGYALFGLAVGALDVGVNTRAAAIERAYGRSIFASFYAAWSAAGVLAALATAATARLGWSVGYTLTAQASLVLLLVCCVRGHTLPRAADENPPSSVDLDTPAHIAETLGRRVWVRLLPFGLVLLVVYVVDSTVSAWSAVYLRQTLSASLTVAPLAYAAYQAGTVTGRSCADRLVRRIGATRVVRTALLLTAGAMAGLATAPSWPFAVLAAAGVGLGASSLTPLCQASAARLNPAASEAILARLNLFNYVGVLTGGAVSGILGTAGHFRFAYAAPAALAVLLLTCAPYFARAQG
ncbi:MFS transporter [Streptomyces sp. NPDC005476]|uniref:MFS transporter n=1 Tax=Streptomyces sp. NPDC005476 TaxID=3156882 RepID=UPI003452590D